MLFVVLFAGANIIGGGEDVMYMDELHIGRTGQSAGRWLTKYKYCDKGSGE